MGSVTETCHVFGQIHCVTRRDQLNFKLKGASQTKEEETEHLSRLWTDTLCKQKEEKVAGRSIKIKRGNRVPATSLDRHTAKRKRKQRTRRETEEPRENERNGQEEGPW